MRPGDELEGRGRAHTAQQTAQAPSGTTETREARDPRPSTDLRDFVQGGVRDASRVWWWYLILGTAWIWYGMFVLSYRVGSLAAVAGLVGVAFLFGGFGQLLMAGRVDSMRPLLIVTGVLGIAAGIATFVWPDITLYVVSLLVAWFLIVFGIVHLVSSLAGQGPVVVDPTAARDRRARPGRVGHSLVGAVAADVHDARGSVGHRQRGQRGLRGVLLAGGRQAAGAECRLTPDPGTSGAGPDGR